MPNPTELKQEAASLLEEAQSIIRTAEEEDRKVTAEEDQRFDQLMDEHNELVAEAERIRQRQERLNEAADRTPEPKAGRQDFSEDTEERDREFYEQAAEEYRESFRRYCLNGLSGLTPQDVDVLRRGRPQPDRREFRESDVVVGTSNTGGVFAPTEFEERLWEEMKDFGDMRQTNATILQTPHGRQIDFPTMTDTSNTGSLVSEATTNSSISNVDLDLKSVYALKYQSGPFALSREFLADSRLAPEQWIRRIIRTRLGRAIEADYIDSTGGAAAPEGLINASTGAVTVASSTALGFAELYDLKHSVDRAYRANGAEWLFTDQTFKVISKLTDSQGQFLLQPRVTQNAPQMLLGAPVRINNSSTAIEFGSGNNKVIWYGDFSHFLIRDVMEVVVRRLDERFALSDKVGFVGFVRTDSRVMQDPNITAAQKPIRCILETS